MTHIHIPDGVLPTWLWVTGWVAALLLLWLSAKASSDIEARRRVPLLAVIASVMLVTMSSEIVPLAYHLNLTVVAGVLLGPALSPIAAFVVVLILALLGHGGITVVGLNTILIAAEMLRGAALFRAFVRVLGRPRVRTAAFASTVLTLAVTTALLVAVVGVAGTVGATSRETGALDPGTLTFANPFSEGVFQSGLFGEAGGEAPAPAPAPPPAPAAEGAEFSVARFAAVVFVLGPIGWVLEAFIASLVLGYVARVRPSLLWGPREAAPVLPAHETVH